MSFGRGGPGTPGIPGSNSRTKRMRTSFKHHQLRTMKSYFAINHNPDAKDLKQLSQKTGLPKRVLQVKTQIFFTFVKVIERESRAKFCEPSRAALRRSRGNNRAAKCNNENDRDPNTGRERKLPPPVAGRVAKEKI